MRDKNNQRSFYEKWISDNLYLREEFEDEFKDSAQKARTRFQELIKNLQQDLVEKIMSKNIRDSNQKAYLAKEAGTLISQNIVKPMIIKMNALKEYEETKLEIIKKVEECHRKSKSFTARIIRSIPLVFALVAVDAFFFPISFPVVVILSLINFRINSIISRQIIESSARKTLQYKRTQFLKNYPDLEPYLTGEDFDMKLDKDINELRVKTIKGFEEVLDKSLANPETPSRQITEEERQKIREERQRFYDKKASEEMMRISVTADISNVDSVLGRIRDDI